MIYFGIWLTGFICFIFADAYFDWRLGESPSLIILAALWPLMGPVAIIISLHEKLNTLGKKHRAQKEQAIKFRIAEEAKAQKILQESEIEVENFVEELQQKSR